MAASASLVDWNVAADADDVDFYAYKHGRRNPAASLAQTCANRMEPLHMDTLKMVDIIPTRSALTAFGAGLRDVISPEMEPASAALGVLIGMEIALADKATAARLVERYFVADDCAAGPGRHENIIEAFLHGMNAPIPPEVSDMDDGMQSALATAQRGDAIAAKARATAYSTGHHD